MFKNLIKNNKFFGKSVLIAGTAGLVLTISSCTIGDPADKTKIEPFMEEYYNNLVIPGSDNQTEFSNKVQEAYNELMITGKTVKQDATKITEFFDNFDEKDLKTFSEKLEEIDPNADKYHFDDNTTEKDKAAVYYADIMNVGSVTTFVEQSYTNDSDNDKIPEKPFDITVKTDKITVDKDNDNAVKLNQDNFIVTLDNGKQSSKTDTSHSNTITLKQYNKKDGWIIDGNEYLKQVNNISEAEKE